MKKIKLFIIAFISLLLPSCSNAPSPSLENNNIVSDETERLNDYVTLPPTTNSMETDINSTKLPIGGTRPSGENIQNARKSLKARFRSNFKCRFDWKKAGEKNSQTIKNSNKELLASYSTKVYTKTADRQKNLRIVCDKLSGTILAPNQEFSYNNTCGPYNKENGFGKATIFVGNGIEKQDYGGGVCQLSSTLYNAVKGLNVQILERHKHSKKVYYVPDGQDATVSYGNLDFRFKNLNDYSLLIEASSSAQTVDVNIYKV